MENTQGTTKDSWHNPEVIIRKRARLRESLTDERVEGIDVCS